MADKDSIESDLSAAATPPTSSIGSASNNSDNLVAAKIQRYFVQLTEGCGKVCTHPFCGSNPALKRFNLTRNQSAILAYNLATKDKSGALLVTSNHKSGAASNNPENAYVDVPTLSAAIQECEQTQAQARLIRMLGEVFSTSSSLNNSFIKNPADTYLDGNDIGLDLNSLREAWSMILKLPDNLQAVMVSAAGRLASELKGVAGRTNSPFQLRQYVILLDMPHLMEPTNHQELLLPLMVAISRLPTSYQNLLCDWYFSTFDQARFISYLHMIKDAIALNALSQGDDYNPHKDQLTVASTSVLSMLNRINLTRKFVRYDEFYLDSVNEAISLKDDYINWKRDHSGFSFCNHPYLLNPEKKAKILRIESAVQQYRQRAETINLALLGFATSPYLVLRVFRKNLIYSSLQALDTIAKTRPEDLKKELKVQFVEEEGVDEGGVQKEWFQLLVKQIFDPLYGMFIVESQTQTHWFNMHSTEYADFDLIGKLLGLAIYNGHILDVHFPLLVYKKLQGEPVGLEDLPQINPELAKGLKQLLAFEGDVAEAFDLTFQISYDVYGNLETYDLKPGGDKIPVTNENRQEYVDLYVKWLLVDSVSKQFEAFKKGFKAVCDSEAMQMFRPEELELLICGDPKLDFEELEKSAEYENGFSPDHIVIKYFWQVVHSLTLEQKKRLLFFCTGSDRAPIGGLGKLKLVIVRHGGDGDRLPSAHTCFNHLLLPEYKSKDQLQACLLKAIENAEGFGMI